MPAENFHMVEKAALQLLPSFSIIYLVVFHFVSISCLLISGVAIKYE